MKVIKEILQTLFISRKRLFVFLCLFFFTSILPLPFFGSNPGYAASFFSVTSNNEPVKDVLARISKSTGYKIEITKGWDNKTLTVDLRKVDLEQGLREIMRIMDGPNYSLIINESKKKVEIRIFDNALVEQKKGGGAYVGTNNDFRRRNRVAGEGAMVDVNRGVEKPEEPPAIEITPPENEVVNPE